jgi:hypothetical protein
MARKTTDPKLIALLDQLAKADADADRWYVRLKRAFNRLEKARRTAARLRRKIDQRAKQKEAAQANGTRCG